LTPGFRCAAESIGRDEPLAGTASTVRAFLLVENPGPWGIEALRDSRLPEQVRRGLTRAAGAANVRVLLIRRHHRPAPREGFQVFAVYADPVAPWIETTELAHSEDLLELDLESLGRGASAGLTAYDGTLFCVCTHGRHDVCCAERGRPLAQALTAARPDQTWECSHIGGDRFAGNLLVLPAGLYYGRLDAASAGAVADAAESGEVELEHLRGRSGHPMPVQAAEIALRRELGETREGALRLRELSRNGGVSRALFDAADASYEVEVHTSPGPSERLTCRGSREQPVPEHRVVAIRRT
jgi:hypothetical protein